MEFTAESVFENLRSANIFGEPSEEGLVELDRALVDPGLAVEWFYPGKFVQLILRDRIFEVALSSQCEDPDYEKLFNEMAGQAGLSDLVSDVTQSYDSEGNWFLSYTLAGGAMRFKICNMDEFSGLCDRPVISHFNELLSVRGMPIRAFRFGGETGDDPMFGSYIVADSSRFVAVCRDLAIPFIEYKD